jgi:lipoteichoic acid synthase
MRYADVPGARRRRWLGAVAVAATLAACLPNPQSIKERRESFPRDDLRGELILQSLPSGAERVDAVFGERAKLVACRLDPPRPSPGDRVTVTFYWSAIKPLDEDYQVFVHGDALEGNTSRLHGDHFPARGKYPTDVWLPGEIVVDAFTLWIPPGYGAKRLGLYTGLYKSNYRVPLTDRGARPGDAENRSLAVEISFP